MSGSNHLKRFLKYINQVITSCKLHSVGATLYAGWSINHVIRQAILLFPNVRVFPIKAFVPSCSKNSESTSNNSIWIDVLSRKTLLWRSNRTSERAVSRLCGGCSLTLYRPRYGRLFVPYCISGLILLYSLLILWKNYFTHVGTFLESSSSVVWNSNSSSSHTVRSQCKL